MYPKSQPPPKRKKHLLRDSTTTMSWGASPHFSPFSFFDDEPPIHPTCGLTLRGIDRPVKPSHARRKAYNLDTLPETNRNWDGWNTNLLLGWPIFRGYVSFREGNTLYLVPCEEISGVKLSLYLK